MASEHWCGGEPDVGVLGRVSAHLFTREGRSRERQEMYIYVYVTCWTNIHNAISETVVKLNLCHLHKL